MGQVLLEAGKADEAQAKFTESVRLLDGADVPAGVKEANQRANLYFEARVALAKGDAKGAAAKAGTYRTQAEAKKIPFELRRIHELDGRIALAEKKFDLATAELAQANDQNPSVLYALAKAYEGAGDKAKAQGRLRQGHRLQRPQLQLRLRPPRGGEEGVAPAPARSARRPLERSGARAGVLLGRRRTSRPARRAP